MRLKLISCEVFFRELGAVVSRSANEVDVEFLPKPLHQTECRFVRCRLQGALDRVAANRYQAVLLAYGLCHQGVLGLQARSVPVVMPRADDCSTLLRGGKQRYLGYVHSHPAISCPSRIVSQEFGSFSSRGHRLSLPSPVAGPSGCAKAGGGGGEPMELLDASDFNSPDVGNGLNAIHAGEEALGIADFLEFQARREAEWFGWDFERALADLAWLQRFVDGYWSHEEFLVVPPGYRVVRAIGEGLIAAEEIKS